MIHFRCRCGRTLSVSDEDAGRPIECAACKTTTPAPESRPVAPERPRRRKSTGDHDFDAEIVKAARSAPPRPVKTPGRVSAAAGSEDAEAGREPDLPAPPGYDLLRVGAAARWLGMLAVTFLGGGAAGAVLTFLLLDARVSIRIAAGALLLLAGVGGAAASLALRQVARTVLGLALRQRDLAERLLSREEATDA